MSQQTQSDIFHIKMLQNALWCQITWSKCMLCNILEYCSQTLDIHGHYPIFEVDKLSHDEFFLILNINHIFNIICPSTAKTHSTTYQKNYFDCLTFSVNFSNCQFEFHVLEYYLAVTVHLNIQLT
jgi:hypothetical protein